MKGDVLVESAILLVSSIKPITIFTPDEQQHTFSQGEVIDPVTGIQIPLEKVFECLA